jgi:hypothetical protein
MRRPVSWIDPTTPDIRLYQGQCGRICTCAARPHSPLSYYPLSCLGHLSISRVLSHPIEVLCVLPRTGERSSMGTNLEQFRSECHAQSDILDHKPTGFGIWQSSYGAGWWFQGSSDHRYMFGKSAARSLACYRTLFSFAQ